MSTTWSAQAVPPAVANVIQSFNVTTADLQKYLNPNYDINGFQIGDLFLIEDQLDSTVRTGDRQLTINPGLGAVSADQLSGYLIVLDDDYSVTYQIVKNSKTNSDGALNLYLASTLPTADGSTWSIRCIHTRVDLHEVDAETEWHKAVLELRNRMPYKYTQMLQRILGQKFWPRESVGYLENDTLTVTLAFKSPTNIKVWQGIFYEYANRQQDAQLLAAGSDYSASLDANGYTQLTLAAAPPETHEVLVDFDHALDPCPQTLVDLALELFKVRIYRRFMQIKPGITLEVVKEMEEHVVSQLELGIPEFDDIELWRETKTRKQHGIGTIKLSRGG